MTARTRIGNIVRVEGRDVHVRQDGPEHAPVLVLLHGFSCSMHWFDHLTRQLESEYRVIRVDLVGHGCTGGASGLDTESQAQVMTGVLDAIGVTGATVAGHSFGADVALGMAQRSERVARVVIISQGPDYTIARFPRGAFLPVAPVVAALAHRVTPPWLATLSTRIAFAPGYRTAGVWDDPRRVAWDRSAMVPGMYRTVLTDRRKRLTERPLDVRVRSLDQPVLAILGGRDQMYPCPPTAERYRTAGAEVVVIDDAGHSPHVERPTQVAALIRGFGAAIERGMDQR